MHPLNRPVKSSESDSAEHSGEPLNPLAVLERRLAALERENRRLKRAVGGVLAALAGVWFVFGGPPASADSTQPKPKDAQKLVAGQLVLVDAQGHTRGELGASGESGGTLLRLLDEDGNNRFLLSEAKKSVSMAMLDDQGKVRSTMGLGKDGPFWRFDDSNGRQRMAAGVVRDGSFFRLDDENGIQRVGILVSRVSASITVFNAAGQVVISRQL